MFKINTLRKIVWDTLRITMLTIKFWLGVSIGIILILKYTVQFIGFSLEINQPINILEPFFYVCNNFKTSMFIFLGLLLILSDAPFVKSRTLQLVCKTTRRIWNISVIADIVLLTFFYYGSLMIFSICITAFNGYIGISWSIPMVEVATGNQLAMTRFNLAFEYYEYILENSLVLASIKSFFGVMLYGILEGLILYTFNMNSKWSVGIISAIAVHFLSYVAFTENIRKYSLLTYSIGAEEKTYVILFLIIIVYKISSIRCEYVDIDCAGEE